MGVGGFESDPHSHSRACQNESKPMLTAAAYDTQVEQLLDRIQLLHSLLTAAGVPYRIVGGMAVFIHVFERDPLRARLTSDIDAAIDRQHLPAVIEAARKAGWVYRQAAGVDMLTDAAQPRTRSARSSERESPPGIYGSRPGLPARQDPRR